MFNLHLHMTLLLSYKHGNVGLEIFDGHSSLKFYFRVCLKLQGPKTF